MPEDSSHLEIKRLLESNAALLKENNELLRKLRRQALWGAVFKTLWVIILLGLPLYLYYALQPQIDSLRSIYQETAGMSGQVQDLQNLLDLYNQSQR